jgi:hypothetical protein
VPEAVVQFLATEHFALQTAKTTTTTEINGRMQPYLSLLSAVILALAFIAQVTEMSSTFYGFALVLLPLVYFLGVTTMERVDRSGTEWVLYQMGMNRIRHFYVEVAPDHERILRAATRDDRTSTIAPTGVERTRWNWMTGVSGMIAAVNSLIAGRACGLAAHQAGHTRPWLGPPACSASPRASYCCAARSYAPGGATKRGSNRSSPRAIRERVEDGLYRL